MSKPKVAYRSAHGPQMAPWADSPTQRLKFLHKVLPKLEEMERELAQAQSTIQALKRVLQSNREDGDEALLLRPTYETSGWVMSLMESWAYVERFLRGNAGTGNFHHWGLQAMGKGDKLGTTDARSVGIKLDDSGIDYSGMDYREYAGRMAAEAEEHRGACARIFQTR
jgi:hypothetical protein